VSRGAECSAVGTSYWGIAFAMKVHRPGEAAIRGHIFIRQARRGRCKHKEVKDIGQKKKSRGRFWVGSNRAKRSPIHSVRAEEEQDDTVTCRKGVAPARRRGIATLDLHKKNVGWRGLSNRHGGRVSTTKGGEEGAKLPLRPGRQKAATGIHGRHGGLRG